MLDCLKEDYEYLKTIEKIDEQSDLEEVLGKVDKVDFKENGIINNINLLFTTNICLKKNFNLFKKMY